MTLYRTATSPTHAMSGFSSPLLREDLDKMSLSQKLQAVPFALWNRSTRRIRMLGALILFLYVPPAAHPPLHDTNTPTVSSPSG